MATDTLFHALPGVLDDPKSLGLRPSVLCSDFFREYSIKRILMDPGRAWYDLVHTRGVGRHSARRVAFLVAAQVRRQYPEAWREAVKIHTKSAAPQTGTPSGPAGSIATFFAVWQPPMEDSTAVDEHVRAR